MLGGASVARHWVVGPDYPDGFRRKFDGRSEFVLRFTVYDLDLIRIANVLTHQCHEEML